MFGEMPITKYEHKGDHDHLIIFPIGDIHLGSPHFNPKHLLRVLREVEANRENSRIIIMGDVIEKIIEKQKENILEEINTPSNKDNPPADNG